MIAEEEKLPIEKIYDFGIRVQWFPALVAKFPDRLEEIAEKILDEVAEIGSTTIFMHRFPFGDEQVMIVTSWDDDLDMLFADADLVAYMDTGFCSLEMMDLQTVWISLEEPNWIE